MERWGQGILCITKNRGRDPRPVSLHARLALAIQNCHFFPSYLLPGFILTKQRLAQDAADLFRLLRAFRSIKHRATRQRLIETVEAMAEGRILDAPPDEKAGKPHG